MGQGFVSLYRAGRTRRSHGTPSNELKICKEYKERGVLEGEESRIGQGCCYTAKRVRCLILGEKRKIKGVDGRGHCRIFATPRPHAQVAWRTLKSYAFVHKILMRSRTAPGTTPTSHARYALPFSDRRVGSRSCDPSYFRFSLCSLFTFFFVIFLPSWSRRVLRPCLRPAEGGRGRRGGRVHCPLGLYLATETAGLRLALPRRGLIDK